jgi:uncharacterized protein (DUF885 family)
LTGKLFCAHCGAPYYRRESKSKDGVVNSKWVCSNKINNGADACPSFPLYEAEIKPILFEVFGETRVDVEVMIESYNEMFLSLQTDDDALRQIEEQERIAQLAEQKKNKLLELVTLGAITPANFQSMTERCDKEIEETQKTIKELREQQLTKEEYLKHIAEVRARLNMAIRDASSGMITNEFVAQYIDKIIVTSIDHDTANLQIKIFTGKNTEKWLKKLHMRSKGRMGVTSKKMVESYENSLKTK